MLMVDGPEATRAGQSPTGSVNIMTLRPDKTTKPTGDEKLRVKIYDESQKRYGWVSFTQLRSIFRFYNMAFEDLTATYKMEAPPAAARAKMKRLAHMREDFVSVKHVVTSERLNSARSFTEKK